MLAIHKCNGSRANPSKVLLPAVVFLLLAAHTLKELQREESVTYLLKMAIMSVSPAHRHELVCFFIQVYDSKSQY